MHLVTVDAEESFSVRDASQSLLPMATSTRSSVRTRKLLRTVFHLLHVWDMPRELLRCSVSLMIPVLLGRRLLDRLVLIVGLAGLLLPPSLTHLHYRWRNHGLT